MARAAHTMHRPRQYDLFGAAPRPETPPDDAAFTSLQQEVARLRLAETRLGSQLKDLLTKNEDLASRNRSLQWQLLTAEATQRGPDSGREALARELIKLAHPDKWSQGQPATELAHEITVRLTATRRGR